MLQRASADPSTHVLVTLADKEGLKDIVEEPEEMDCK